MTNEDDSSSGEEGEVEETPEIDFGEVEFEEIPVGFEEGFKTGDSDESVVDSPGEDLADPDDLREFLALGFMTDVFDVGGIGGLDLEGVLFDDVSGAPRWKDEGKSGDGDFYKTDDDVGHFYESDIYIGSPASESGKETSGAGYDEFVDVSDVNVSVDPISDRGGERSILEISGFRDEAAEKKRKRRREGF